MLWLTAAREGPALPEPMGCLSSGVLQVGLYPLCLAAQALVYLQHYLQWLLGSVLTRGWSDHCYSVWWCDTSQFPLGIIVNKKGEGATVFLPS